MPKLLWMTLVGGGQAVGGARGIADNLHVAVVPVMVHTHHRHGSIHRRGRDDDPLGSTLQVSPSLLHGGEDTSELHNIFSTTITPFYVGGISLLEDGDRLSIDDKLPIPVDCAVKLAVSGIILEHVDHVVVVNERITDGDNVHFARVKSNSCGQVPNMAKSVHSNLHYRVSGLRLALCREMQLSVEQEEQRANFQPFSSHDTHKAIIQILWLTEKYIFANLTKNRYDFDHSYQWLLLYWLLSFF
ncbi:hypothetical protein HJG60_010220 [Phyllostomus discolor]|uniref:Uncharacterized protein n=1 Tax=Phyllostomus discolor TaxID=89673 RepID=A0A834AZN5_9CHIR|nr:hypothetical protein HJG60_010220 [Phyllostomus discolor]